MKDYKLIVSDLDGTLLRRDMTLSKENLEALEKFNELGITFVASSGRTLMEIPECVRENPNIRYITYSNGSAVYDKEKECDIISHRISKETTNRAIDILSDYDVLWGAHIDGRDYYDKDKLSDEIFEYYQVNDYYGRLLREGAHTDDIEALTRETNKNETFIVFFHNDEEIEKATERLRELGTLTVTTSVAHELEICSAEAGKGTTLEELSNMLGISGDEIIALGDSANDTSMFPYAALAICASNGSEEAKELADEVGCSCEEHLADYVLKKHINTEPKPEKKMTLRSKLITAIAAAAVVIAVISSIIAFGANSAKKFFYSEKHTASSWSATYQLLDGKIRRTITPDDDTLSFSIKTESGSISIEILDSEGNTFFDKDDIGTEAFEVKVDGKVRVIIEAEDHKGSFVIG